MNAGPETATIADRETVRSADYDRMAPAYAWITGLISLGGNARSQRFFLDFLGPETRVLTVGCGSIGFNADLAKTGARVTYLDLSPKMIGYARKRLEISGCAEKAGFVCMDVMRYRPEAPYDVVLANFFLNTFAWPDCVKVLGALAGFLGPSGLLCIADETVGLKASTRLMQKAFRPALTWLHHVWADHPMHPIYAYGDCLESMGFRAVAQKRDASDYLLSTVYRKSAAGSGIGNPASAT